MQDPVTDPRDLGGIREGREAAAHANGNAFAGRAVVVTGGTGALGRAVVERLLAAGARVWIPNFDTRLSAEVSFAKDPRVTIVENVNLTDEVQVVAFYAGLPPLWASIHLTGGFAMTPALETSAAEFRRMFELNATTCFLTCREAARNMREAGHGGRLVNVTARAACVPAAGMAAYSVAKVAVIGVTESLAEEFRASGILVNAVAPSLMDTPDNRRAMPSADFTRWPKVDEVARAIAFLASADNTLTTGLVMPVYGNA